MTQTTECDSVPTQSDCAGARQQMSAVRTRLWGPRGQAVAR
jgi:hypothetical protein